jgi:ABC-type uncharacterized transport system substrate-binding protein
MRHPMFQSSHGAGADPVSMGWAQTLARPGGVITGMFLPQGAILKRFELLKTARPQATTFGFLMNSRNPGNPRFRKVVAMRLGHLASS